MAWIHNLRQSFGTTVTVHSLGAELNPCSMGTTFVLDGTVPSPSSTPTLQEQCNAFTPVFCGANTHEVVREAA